MGELADAMINGEACSECGVELEPGERVYTLNEDGTVNKTNKQYMPKDGRPFGVPVTCKDCKDD